MFCCVHTAIYPETAAILGYCRGEAVYSRECLHTVGFDTERAISAQLIYISIASNTTLFCQNRLILISFASLPKMLVTGYLKYVSVSVALLCTHNFLLPRKIP